MILDELILTDFGVYRGRQVFPLRPAAPERPIILIGAQNGGGKTTFLEGLQLAFFGRLAQLRGGVSFDQYLRRAINRQADPAEGAAVEVSFTRTVEARAQLITVRRAWSVQNGVLRHTFDVEVDGVEDRVLTSQWPEYVETMLPPRIAPLFFFDGEKIEQFAQLDGSAEIVSTAISGLLGLDIVDRLQVDLEVFERRKAAGGADRDAERALQAAAANIEAADAAYAVAFDEVGGAKREFEVRQARVTGAELALKKDGGDLYASRTDLRALEQGVETRFEAAERELRTWAGGVGPLLLVPELMREVADQATREADGEAARQVAAVLKQRDRALLAELKSVGASGTVLQTAQRFLGQEQDRLQKQAGVSRYLELPAASHATLEGLLSEGLADAEDLRRALLTDIENLQAERDDIARQLASVPAGETIAPHLATVRAENEALADAELRLAASQRRLEAAKRALDLARARYRSTFDAQVASHLLDEDARRMVAHAQKVRATLQRFHRAVVDHHIGRIEALLLEGLQRLMRKDDLITGVSIDPATFAIALSGEGWDNLPAEQLSAGERQLFAVALLWALARASGQTAPTVIDTPLGRLDSAHRLRLVETYFPQAAEQVILLSTDEEIDARHYAQLKPHLSRSLTIEYDPATRGSRVRDGYLNVPALEEA